MFTLVTMYRLGNLTSIPYDTEDKAMEDASANQAYGAVSWWLYAHGPSTGETTVQEWHRLPSFV